MERSVLFRNFIKWWQCRAAVSYTHLITGEKFENRIDWSATTGRSSYKVLPSLCIVCVCVLSCFCYTILTSSFIWVYFIEFAEFLICYCKSLLPVFIWDLTWDSIFVTTGLGFSIFDALLNMIGCHSINSTIDFTYRLHLLKRN